MRKTIAWRLRNISGSKMNKEEIEEYLETNNSENTATQNLQNAAKASSEKQFLLIQVSLKQRAKSQINHLTQYLKELEKNKQNLNSARKGNTKVREVIHKIEIF